MQAMGYSDNGGIRVSRKLAKISAGIRDIIFGCQLLGSRVVAIH
jgi:hypothetical protein